MWKGENYDKPLRQATVHNTRAKQWGLRMGKWVYINQPSGQVSKMPDSFKELRGYTDFDTPGLLFDMETDPEQRVNLYEKHPEIVEEMKAILKQYREQGYSVKH